MVLYYIKITGRELFNQFKIIKGVKSFTTRKNYDDIKTDSFQILKPWKEFMIIRAPISSFPLTNLTTIGDIVDTASSNQTADNRASSSQTADKTASSNQTVENTVLQPLATYTDTHL